MKRYSPLIVRGSMLLMESFWVYALVAWLVAVTVGGGRPTFLGVAAVIFVSHGISRGLQNSSISLGILRFWGAFLSLLVFYAIVRVDYYGDLRFWDLTFLDDILLHTTPTLSDAKTAVTSMPVLWVFWMRGVLRSQQSIAFEDVIHSFALGLVVVAFVALFSGMDDLPRAVDFIPVPYVAVGLLAIGLTHASQASDQFDRGFAKDWLVFVGGGLVSLAVIGLLFAVVDFEAARHGLELVGRGIGFVFAGVLYVIVWPIIKLLTLLLEAMRFLIDLWGGSKNPPIDNPQGQIPNPEDHQGATKGLPGGVETGIRFIVGGGLLTALFVGTAMLFQRFRKDANPDEARESTYQEGRLANDLGDMLSNFLGRFRGHGRQSDDQVEPARRLYFEMLDTAAARGVERRPMETPLELVPRINRTISGSTPGEITRLFDDVRYGALPPSDEELRRLREAWEQLPK